MIGGATSPALAGHSNASGGRIKGDARTANAAKVSVDVRQGRLQRGHLDYRSADGRYKVRCEGFNTYSPRLYVQPGPPAAVVTGDCRLRDRQEHTRTPVTVEAEFVDNSSFTRGQKDEVNLIFTRPDGSQVTDRGVILSGNITVR